LSRATGDQLAPPPTVVSVPKSEKCSTSALALSVSDPIAPPNPLRLVIGRSKLTRPVAWSRLRLALLVTPARRAKLSSASVSTLDLTVMLARPAGSVSSGPFAVPSIPAEVRVEVDRSRA